MSSSSSDTSSRPTHLIRAIVENDLADGSTGGRVVTRFPPEPNGYLHIGHAKSICLNFGLAADYNGKCHLRFDDTNPDTEDMEYVESIMADVRWLGFDWGDNLFFASDYFEQLYQYAEQLIQDGKAYVDSSSEDDIRKLRGTVTEPGKPSLYRSRSIEANLSLFREMRAGKYPDGAHVLRAKIDLGALNMKMRDPLLYRIRHAHHYRTGDEWCIYPFYDWAHPLSDAIEDITHSLCTLEFENNRALYDWVVDNTRQPPRPHQYEFARLNLDYTVMSKRKFIQLVDGNHVNGWDDPRMPTIAGMRRRGYTPAALREFSEGVGVAKTNSKSEVAALEYAVRDNLNPIAPRVMCVIDPIKVVLTNYTEDGEVIDAPYYPHDIGKEGTRPVPFSRELYIERGDFMEDPPKRFHRLSPGQEVRLRYAYVIKCVDVIKDADGKVTELRCEYDPETRSGGAPLNRKVKGTVHWVSAATAVPVEVRLYDRLFAVPDPGEGEKEYFEEINPESDRRLTGAWIEPSIVDDPEETRYQFTRRGYFWRDPVDSTPEKLVFNRIVTLKDSWAKIAGGKTGGNSENGAKGQPHGNASGSGAKSGGSAAVGKHGKHGKHNAKSMQTSKEVSRPAEKVEPGPISEAGKQLMEAHGLAEHHARLLADDDALHGLFDRAVASSTNPIAIANWVINEVPAVASAGSVELSAIDGSSLTDLVELVEDGTITGRVAKELLPEILTGDNKPAALVEERGLGTMQDADKLAAIVAEVIAGNPEKTAAYRGGKKGLIGFFMGQVMQRTGGRADPGAVRAQLTSTLDE